MLETILQNCDNVSDFIFQITSIDSNKDSTADVNFYMADGSNEVVPASTATAVYNKLHPSDISAYMQAQVRNHILENIFEYQIYLIPLKHGRSPFAPKCMYVSYPYALCHEQHHCENQFAFALLHRSEIHVCRTILTT